MECSGRKTQLATEEIFVGANWSAVRASPDPSDAPGGWKLVFEYLPKTYQVAMWLQMERNKRMRRFYTMTEVHAQWCRLWRITSARVQTNSKSS